MKEYLYPNIWAYCEKQYPVPTRALKWLRRLLLCFAVYYLLMCFAYLFAKILAYRYDNVNYVSAGQAINLFIIMLFSVAAAAAGWICSLRRAPLCGMLLAAAVTLLSPFALWNAAINTVFKVHHLTAMLLLLLVQATLCILDLRRKKKIRRQYDILVAQALAAHGKAGVMLSREETENILQSFDPAACNPYKPLKRSQKSRIRKRQRN